MSGDLISRSAVIKIIEDEMKQKLSYVKHNAQIDILFKIKEMPTAYDVDKVVERLEEKTEIAYNRYMDCNPNTPASVYARYGTQYNERKACLEIVKSGLKQ